MRRLRRQKNDVEQGLEGDCGMFSSPKCQCLLPYGQGSSGVHGVIAGQRESTQPQDDGHPEPGTYL